MSSQKHKKFIASNRHSIVLAEEVREDNEEDAILAFTSKRHLEKIEGFKTITQTWRMKERVSIILLHHLP